MSFVSTGTTVLGTLPAGFQVVGSGDYDKDGRSDVLLHNSSNAQTQVWLAGGSPPAVLGNGSPGTFPSNLWSVSGTGDFGGDGFFDVLWHRTGVKNPAF